MSLLDQLDAEWDELAPSAVMRRALARWRADDPALAFPDMGALVAAVERRDVHPATTDRILAALARRAPDDDHAARTLLQLLLPGCKSLVRRSSVWSRDERAAFVVAATWDRIRTYPIERRPAKIAANILLDVRQRLARTAAKVREHPGIDALPGALVPHVEPGPEPAVEVVDLLAWAVRSGHLDADSARLIALTRLGGVRVAEIARLDGEKEQTIRRRRLRAEQRLRAAVAIG